MLPRFFKDMPKRKDWNKQGKWDIGVFTIHLFRNDNTTYSSVYEGRLIMAYLKIRLKALLKDWATAGAEHGVGWYINKHEKE